MSSVLEMPLVRSLTTRHAMPVLHDLSEADSGLVLLFLPSHARVHLETPDIAVVMPELLTLCNQYVHEMLYGAVADSVLEAFLLHVLDSPQLPALVLLKQRQPVGVISRMRDWDDYKQRLQALLREAHCSVFIEEKS
ncbi:MAG: hypothetical protein J6P47_04245 [Acetobacter sp.]|nr:hypothetical protein [Acetobacter sp.]